jgi:hypothetical protein
MSLRPVVGSITCDAFSAIVSHAVRLPIGVEAQGWPEFQGICKAALQQPLEEVSRT